VSSEDALAFRWRNKFPWKVPAACDSMFRPRARFGAARNRLSRERKATLARSMRIVRRDVVDGLRVVNG